MARQEVLEKKYRQRLFREIGEYLGQKRQETGLKQSDIARLSGYSAQFISNIECGMAFPPPKLMTKMIEAYHLREDEFLGALMQFQLKYYKEVYFEESARRRGSRPAREA